MKRHGKERQLVFNLPALVRPCDRSGWFLCVCKPGATGLLGLLLAGYSLYLGPESPHSMLSLAHLAFLFLRAAFHGLAACWLRVLDKAMTEKANGALYDGPPQGVKVRDSRHLLLTDRSCISSTKWGKFRRMPTQLSIDRAIGSWHLDCVTPPPLQRATCKLTL
ncbi:hypothetical protein J3F83DRAFT_416344 [Trichoderma novae-zelandiae]